MSTIARDTWLKKRPAVKTDLIKKSIVVPVFDYECFELNQSLYFSPFSTFGGSTDVIPDFTDEATFEAWVKLPYVPLTGRYVIFARGIETSMKPQYEFSVEQNHLFLALTKGGASSLFGDSRAIPQGVWFHAAVVWDGTNVTFYINGEDKLHAGTLTAPVDALGAGIEAIGNEFLVPYQFVGNMNEVRIWNVARTKEQIVNAMFSPRNVVEADGLDDDLVGYAKCRMLVPLSDKETPQHIGALNDFGVPDGTIEDPTTWAPLVYGGSWVVAKFPVTLSAKCSFRFPVAEPEDANHSLVVRWTDDDGISQRRYFYKPDGVDFYTGINEYNGEAIAASFELEIWNIDGIDTVSLEEELTLHISQTAEPSTPIDRTSTEAVTLVADNALAEPFPLTPFPLEFNTVQTYPIT